MATAVERKSGHFYFQRISTRINFPAARKADGSESPRRPRQKRKLELGRRLRSRDVTYHVTST